MPNYFMSTIYKICCNNTDIKDCYVGSTTNFSRRKCQHKTCCNNENSKEYNKRVYKFIRDNGKWENWSMIQVETYDCNTKRELETRERYWIEQLKPSLNTQIPTRTKTEHYQDNRESILAYKKQYDQQNKQKILAYAKQYNQDKKETILAKKKQHYEKNKEMRKCVCGTEFNYGHTSTRNQHYRTKKHTKYIENLQELMCS